MTTFAQTPERSSAPAMPTAIDEFAHLSRSEIHLCLGATETARRVARDRGDSRLVDELGARHSRLLQSLSSR